METFRQKLETLGLNPQQINGIRSLINVEIIGEYEALPIPEFTSPADIERFQELDNDAAVRNALRREQRRKLV